MRFAHGRKIYDTEKAEFIASKNYANRTLRVFRQSGNFFVTKESCEVGTPPSFHTALSEDEAVDMLEDWNAVVALLTHFPGSIEVIE